MNSSRNKSTFLGIALLIISFVFIFQYSPIVVHATASSTTTVHTGLINPLAGAHINTICDLVNAILNIIAELAAIVAVIFIIWSGFLFVTAQGNTEKVKKAKSILYTTILGTAVLVGSSIITKIMVDTIGSLTTSVTGATNGTGICASSTTSP